MLSSKIMQGILVIYAFLAAMVVFEKNFKRSIYWFAAFLLTGFAFLVLWGIK